jgi:hypothetical protein
MPSRKVNVNYPQYQVSAQWPDHWALDLLLLAKVSQVHSHRLLLVLNVRLGIRGSEMEDNHVLLEQNLLLEDNPVTQNQEVGVFDIIKQALSIFSKNFNFIIFIFLISLPLFFFMVYYEIFLQRTLVDALGIRGSEMEDNHVLLEQNLLLEDNPVTQNQEVGVFDIIKQALSIFSKNFNFIIFIFLISLPLFFFMVYYEIFLQRTLVDASNILRNSYDDYYYYEWSISSYMPVKSTFLLQLVQLGLLYLVPRHLFELCTIIVIVDLALKIYAEERVITLKEMIDRPIYVAKVKGTFVTSLCVLFLSTCTISGLIWLVTTYDTVFRQSIFAVFFLVFYVLLFVALLTKYLEWSAVWNMSIIISVLEGTYGIEALLHSAYFSRGSERRGLLLMLVFFVWEQGLRLASLYFGCHEEGRGIVVQVGLLWLGNVLKWVVCVPYFYDCKKRAFEKKVDVEHGGAIKAVDEAE